ncbi:MAG: hypothetical protein PHU99_04785 [Candidatus Cloacimonetes bacterium]|jgi:hypothetical protein|nr:hypothetical protein [Candidatus Cloacimonadota bacterium]MDY0337179.1 hypothetical protein [Candidatus Cloacimonadaceae bacterium]MCB5270146.1 hypothetical protein [Candidatus Cloacimonadota bacterium]MCK9333699.1 hypothetical protein [Candidatus Cloacimonadota bacterium]MDD2543567.1 hypothetical protein [Candidatus Cloacimonadota bacterium]
MKDMNDKISDRWKQRRNKGYNWPKLIIMVLVLAAILFAMGILQRTSNMDSVPSASTADSSAIVIPAAEQNP